MLSYKRVLMAVPYRYVNEETVKQGVSFARHHQAHLTLFGVVEEVDRAYEQWLTTKLPRELEQDTKTRQLAALQERVDRIKPDYPNVDCAVSVGIPFVEIIRQIKSGGYDLLILDAVSHQPGHKRFMGSTAKHVLRKCPSPVLCVRDNHPYRKIVAAVDVFSSKEQIQSLNTKVMHHAYGLAQQEGAELHVVYAQQPIGEPMLSSWGIGSADMLDGMEAELIASAKEKMQQLVRQTCGSTEGIQLKTVLGNARDALPLYVKEENIDLITMGTVCRTGIKGFLIGNTAESILDEVDCSILALKPEGFETTVE
ncbi:MAG: universal stress protein [Pseudomonadota bacterium]|nr:hypothetical protein [Pseudomonadales bacterium]MDY6922070.1 universal stress protein [Pseudomonadota bacterium]